MTAPSSKFKSPPVPSKTLEDCFNDAQKLYDEYTHGTFTRSEIGKTLKVSSTSGPFKQRLFTLREFGVINGDGSNFSVSDTFMTMKTNHKNSPEFKAAAVKAIKKSVTFRDLLADFPNKLPSVDAVATRLETQKKFNPDRAKLAARILEQSLKYAGVLDANNNILPVRETPNGQGSDAARENREQQHSDLSNGDKHEDGPGEMAQSLRVEIPIGDTRKVVISYPRDLTGEEAKKVGNVLSAIVS